MNRSVEKVSYHYSVYWFGLLDFKVSQKTKMIALQIRDSKVLIYV